MMLIVNTVIDSFYNGIDFAVRKSKQHFVAGR